MRVVIRCPCVLLPRGLQKQRSDLALGTEFKWLYPTVMGWFKSQNCGSSLKEGLKVSEKSC